MCSLHNTLAVCDSNRIQPGNQDVTQCVGVKILQKQVVIPLLACGNQQKPQKICCFLSNNKIFNLV